MNDSSTILNRYTMSSLHTKVRLIIASCDSQSQVPSSAQATDILMLPFLQECLTAFMCETLTAMKSTIKTPLHIHIWCENEHLSVRAPACSRSSVMAKSQQRQSWITFKVKWQVIPFNSCLLCARQSGFSIVFSYRLHIKVHKIRPPLCKRSCTIICWVKVVRNMEKFVATDKRFTTKCR